MANATKSDRRHFIGGSDARIIMGKDEKALLRLWREKRGEEPPARLVGRPDSSSSVWSPRTSTAAGTSSIQAKRVTDVQRQVIHRTIPWMAATLDGLVKETGAVFEAKFMLPWSFSEEAAAEKHMAQLQHNMLVAGTRKSVLSIITGGGKWIELSIEADPIYQTILIAAEKAFWRSVRDRRAAGLVRLRTTKTPDRSGARGRHERPPIPGRNLPACSAKPDKPTPTMSGPRAN